MRILTASTLLVAGMATAALAAPSQLVLSDQAEVAPPLAVSTPHRDPDFVDVLEAEAKAAASGLRQKTSSLSFDKPSAMWPPTTPPGGGGGWVWASCGQPTDLVEVKSIEVSPDPPVPGKNMTVKARGIVKGRIDVSSTNEDWTGLDWTVMLATINL